MSAELNNEAHAVDDEELDATAPGSQEPAEWQMPEPVFRQTSGKLPQGFEKNYGTAVASAPEATSENDSPAADASDAYTPNSYVEPRPKSSAIKLVLVLLGLGAMIAFIVVFLTVLYFFFLKS
jgi:hypothetical protein